MNLGEHVDEILHEPAPRRHVVLEERWKTICDHLAVDEVHDVERDAEHRVVLADRPHCGNADAERAQPDLQACLAGDIVRGSRIRGPRGPAEDEPLGVSLDQEGEVRTPLTDDPRTELTRPKALLVHERADAVENEERRLLQRTSLCARLDDVG